MTNKLITSISGVFNKWRSLDTDDKFFYFLTGLWTVYAVANLILFVQCIWWMYHHAG